MTSLEIYKSLCEYICSKNLLQQNKIQDIYLSESCNKITICNEGKSGSLKICNPEQKLTQKIQLDGALLPYNEFRGKCCDFLFFVYKEKKPSAENSVISNFFIELKRGSTRQDAISQLSQTHTLLTPWLKSTCINSNTHYVITGQNKILTFQNEKNKLRKKNITLTVCNQISV